MDPPPYPGDSENNNKEVKDIEISENAPPKKRFPFNIIEKSTMLKNLQGDFLHVCILFFLYCLQGIPLGLKSSIPLILTRRSVPYADQATFSISSYPFSMKVYTKKTCLLLVMKNRNFLFFEHGISTVIVT